MAWVRAAVALHWWDKIEETLVGLLGLIALLTLFPIGILRMGYAIKQQRAQDAARNADAVSGM